MMRTWDDGASKEVMELANTTGQLSEAVYYVRNKLGISRRSLAEQAGVSYASIVRFEAGRTALRLDTLVKILDVFGLKIRACSGVDTESKWK